MKALVYHGPGERRWESAADPTIEEPTDVVVRIDSSTICGTDLHILRGDVPEVTPGTVLGHEAVGTVVAKGDAVMMLSEDDRVLVPCTAGLRPVPVLRWRGSLRAAHRRRGLIFGHLIDGLQAEYGVPFGDTSAHKVPAGLSDEQVLFLADIPPTAYEVGILTDGMGDTVVVIGAGPIDLATIMTAKLHTPGKIVAVDLADARLAKALDFGADVVVNNGTEDAVARVMDLTGRVRADVAIEAVGVPETFEPGGADPPGGRVANVGVHGHPATLHLEKLWIRDVLITTGPWTPSRRRSPQADRGRPTRPHRLRDASLLAQPDDGCLRRLRRGCGDERPEGRARRGEATSSCSSLQTASAVATLVN